VAKRKGRAGSMPFIAAVLQAESRESTIAGALALPATSSERVVELSNKELVSDED
jgi:hypothetical protein